MAEPKQGGDVRKAVREARDAAMEAAAKITLGVTSSGPYQRVQSFFLKPFLLWVSLTRRTTEAAMSTALAQLNMPSREDVLSLSSRLTNIEMTLDDLWATLEQVKRTAPQPKPQRAPAREASSGASGHEGRTLSSKEA